MTDCEHCKALANTRNLHRRANERAKRAEEAARIERKRAVDAQALADRHLAQVDELGVENERLRAKMAMCSAALEHSAVAVGIMAEELDVEVMADTQPDVLASQMRALVVGLRVRIAELEEPTPTSTAADDAHFDAIERVKASLAADLMAMQAQRDVAWRKFGAWMAQEWKP